ncbi:MAG: S8 family serine peptidase [Planctomycetota bacterium]|nr:S8 family serine peptidase [Planctomycetota bacterium]
MLASDLGGSDSYPQTAGPMNWFESFPSVDRVSLESLASVDKSLPAGIAGPVEPAVGEWIVQLTNSAAKSLRTLGQGNALLNQTYGDFTIISGLGIDGLLLVRGRGATKSVLESSLSQNENVQSFSLNQLIQGQSTTPNDPEFVAGLMPGMEKIDVTNAWDFSRGSSSTVVGVVDTGIDPTHPDLYLNIWLNQSELPPKYLDDDGSKLVDIDSDGLITFYDLNNVTRSATTPYSLVFGGFASGPNASFVSDLNNNGRIDASDLLADANWADGRDTDNNGFFDDFFGVNFRAGAGDPFAPNNPSDELGHGTHVAGTIGAIGGNATGVVGVNWQTSLMSLRILDNNNQGDSGAAIRAINYAREMRERFRVEPNGRVSEGANVRVLNNSWGQPGGFEVSLEAAIQDSSDAGILFVAASGNGNFLGQGVDNDRTPFYPASYEVDGVIAVAASDAADRTASFSNYGANSVDLLAPGVGIRSTLPGGGYGSANGTSMATPHVAGTAALIWSAFPEATVAEVQKAILSTVDPIANGKLYVSTGGRSSASNAINADVFAPAARLVSKQNITTAGGSTTEFTVEFSHRSGINTTTIGNDDLIVTRQWGPADQLAATLKPNSLTTTAKTATVTYILTAPGGTWDALDFGDYVISTVAGKLNSLVGNKTTEARDIGLFNVRINDSSVLYVTSFADSLQPGTLRSQIMAANSAASEPRTIILQSGRYTIDLAAVVDPASTFGTSLVSLGIANPGGWNNATTGDFDTQGNITIAGDTYDETIIDAQGIDRAFKVHENSTLTLSRLTVQGGVSPATQGGGGILSIGSLNLDQAILKKNAALGLNAANPIYGGAIASWNGNTSLNKSWITENQSDFGGAFFYGGNATATVQRSTLDTNKGGGIYSSSSANGSVENSTLSANLGGLGAIANGVRGGFLVANDNIQSSDISADGRFVLIQSAASNLVPGDTNGFEDIFVYDRAVKLMKRVSISSAGEQATAHSYNPSLSEDGLVVGFLSGASNLVPGDTNSRRDIFVHDFSTNMTERVSVNDSGSQANDNSDNISLSSDGRVVAYNSDASNLVSGDTNGKKDVFLFDRTTRSTERISLTIDGAQPNGDSFVPSVSLHGRYVTFESDATNLVSSDTNGKRDIFVYDRVLKLIERVSVSSTGQQATNDSYSPSLSADGRYVAFHSLASNLTATDANANDDVFVYDRFAKTTEMVSIGVSGLQGNQGSRNSSISGDGRFVAFESSASNFVPNDSNQREDVFVFDRIAKEIKMISLSDAGLSGSDHSFKASISSNGLYVGFQSYAKNLVPGDVNNYVDMFVYDRVEKVAEAITYSAIQSEIKITHSSIVSTSASVVNSIVYGDVKITNSLFALNQAVNELISRFPQSDSSNNIFSDTSQSSRISSLKRKDSSVPVHDLLEGNPAINAATSLSVGTLDQLGKVRVQPDVGAVEALSATVSGKVYADSNKNGRLDAVEFGIPGVAVSVYGSAGQSEAKVVIISGSDSPQTPSVDESGVLHAKELLSGAYQFTAQPISGWSVFKPPVEIVRNQTIQANADMYNPRVSADGRFVSFWSDASNLVPNDTNGHRDVFVYDRTAMLIERVSVNSQSVQGNHSSVDPSISADGRYIAFSSQASNLVAGDTTGNVDVFVFDRVSKSIERVSVNAFGAPGNRDSLSPSISADGRYVTFVSSASNLVPGDTNNVEDIFVYDRAVKSIELVSVSDTRTQGNSYSSNASISADGRFVAFISAATNLVAGDTNGVVDVFVYDRATNSIKRASVSGSGQQSNSDCYNPVISADGGYVAFWSNANTLVQGDTNGKHDIFVHELSTGLIQCVSVSDTGVQGDGTSRDPSISADGRYVVFVSSARNLVTGKSTTAEDIFVFDRNEQKIKRASLNDEGMEASRGSASYTPSISGDGHRVAFGSAASNLVLGDTNGNIDIFVVANPLLASVLAVELQFGQVYTDLNLGLVPNPGVISGRVYEDTVSNGVFDTGEPAIGSAVVFLDLNANGFLDVGERSVTTSADGTYRFLSTDSYRSYSIVVQVPVGYEQVAPGASEEFAWNIFLPAGGRVTDRDFAIRRVQSTGQSSDSAVSGRLYDDRNGDKVFNAGDVPIANREVYLDATNFGVRDANEPRVLTDAQGFYSMTGLSSRTVAVATTVDSSLVHVTPLGSSFTLQKFPLYSSIRPFSNPQAIAAGDFNQDGLLDVAMALGEANKLSIRLNNGLGGFLATEIDVDLGSNGTGPTSLVVGQFDNDSRLDVALTANYSSKVIVLLNYNPTARTFGSQSAVNVGLLPIDLVAGQFGGDSKLDLAVVNQGSTTVASTVQLLTNNGSGGFTAGAAIATGGKTSVSIVAGNFAGDASTDIAIVHASPSTTNTPNGGVTILRGNGAGVWTLEPSYYEVGATPIDSVLTDFNGDGRADLAVANFSSNSISILLGQANGTFRVQTAILGTASGAFDIAVGDIDNDGDMDVIASNLRDRNISIFRNIGVDPLAGTGDVRFEPLENVGLGQFALAQRMPLVVGNFDNDSSGPGGTGTLDIVTIPQRTDTLHVLNNKLVNGSRRVALTGTNSISGLDFIIKSAILSPSFDEITNPAAIVEDSTEQTAQILGIKKGRATGPALRFTARSSNPSLVANPSISFVDGSSNASIRYTTLPNANGISVITVHAIDAGANQIFDDGDDGISERSFTVTVLAVNDAPTMITPPLTSVTQKAGSQSIANFVTGISPGGGSDESPQILSAFTVTTDARFFAVQPSINANGALLFTPNPSNSGSVIVTVTLSDNGGRASGGVDSTTRNFVITILPVNDPPSFRFSADTTIQAVSGPNTLTGFANGFGPGGGDDELSQVVSDYLVSVDSPGLFAVLPSISVDGTLRFTPATDRNGIATVTVRVRDNGGTLNGGVDLSSSQSFSVTVGTAQSLTLNATELGPHEIAIKNGLLVVTVGGATVRSVPAADLTKVTTIDSNGAKLFEVVLPANNLPGMVRFTGTSNPIELIAERSAVDLSILTSDKLFGIGLVDLRAVGANSLAFQASNISAVNGSKTLRILMDRTDTLGAQGSWRAQAGRLENGAWVQPFTNADAKIEVISATPWQNKVNRFDIDGDLALSPLDVLVLVNLINNNTFPNGQLPSRGSTQPDGFFDPDGDNSLGPLDVLTLVNEINRGGSAGGEGEKRSQLVDEVMATELGDWGVEIRPVGLARRKLGNRR